MRKSLYISVASIIMNVLMFTQVFAEVKIGIKESDWVKYSVNASEVTGLKNVDWIKVEVTGMIGYSRVVFSVTYHYLNGTEVTRTENQSFNETLYVTYADLNVGDCIIGVSPLPEYLYVSNITSKNYLSTNRQVVVFNFSDIGKTALLYYDKATGFLLEKHCSLPYYGAEYNLSMLVIDTNLWTTQKPPEPPIEMPSELWSIILQVWQFIKENYVFVLIAIAICLIIIYKKRKHE